MAKKKKGGNLLRNLLILLGVVILFIVVARAMGWIGQEKLSEINIDTVKIGDITEQVTASGKIQPETQIKVSSEISGEIVDLLVKEGDSVVAGQLLARIRPDNLQSAVEAATAGVNVGKANYSQAQAALGQRKAELARLEAEFQRSKRLFDQKVVSEIEYLSAKTNYEVAKQQIAVSEQSIESARYNMQSSQANLSQTMNNLSRSEIYAPASGVISKMSVEKGEKVVGTAQMAGTEMFIIANLNAMEVQVDVNENDIVKVKVGQKVIIEVDAYLTQNRKFEGVVTEIANTANATTSADAITEFKVKIRILNESYKDLVDANSKLSPFRPGMSASVSVLTNRKEKISIVPSASVTTRKNEDKDKKKDETDVKAVNNSAADKKTKKANEVREVVFVFDEKEQIVTEREVKTGISDYENIEIISGLKTGDKVVTGPFLLVSKQLKDKQKVKIAEPKKDKDKDKK
jgi:HlyD family secretion protein